MNPAAISSVLLREIPELNRTITWLHLSDLHTCKPCTGWDAHRVLKTLVSDLKSMESRYHLLPDLIFFTGDLVFGNIGVKSGASITDQFRDAQVFLEKVRNSFTRPVAETNLFGSCRVSGGGGAHALGGPAQSDSHPNAGQGLEVESRPCFVGLGQPDAPVTRHEPPFYSQ